jgi:hypothetical protein
VPIADRHSSAVLFSCAASVLYFLCQGVCGASLFSESLSSSWLIGAALILTGVCCVQWGHSDDDAVNDEVKEGQKMARPTISVPLNSSVVPPSTVMDPTDAEPASPSFAVPSIPVVTPRRRTRTTTTVATDDSDAAAASSAVRSSPRRRAARKG